MVKTIKILGVLWIIDALPTSTTNHHLIQRNLEETPAGPE